MTTRTLEQIIREHPFFHDLPDAYLALIVGCARNERFEDGQVLFHEAEEANRFYVIRDGQVALEVHVPGRGPARLETVAEGDVVGWSWLFPPLPVAPDRPGARQRPGDRVRRQMPPSQVRGEPRSGLRTDETFCTGGDAAA